MRFSTSVPALLTVLISLAAMGPASARVRRSAAPMRVPSGMLGAAGAGGAAGPPLVPPAANPVTGRPSTLVLLLSAAASARAMGEPLSGVFGRPPNAPGPAASLSMNVGRTTAVGRALGFFRIESCVAMSLPSAVVHRTAVRNPQAVAQAFAAAAAQAGAHVHGTHGRGGQLRAHGGQRLLDLQHHTGDEPHLLEALVGALHFGVDQRLLLRQVQLKPAAGERNGPLYYLPMRSNNEQSGMACGETLRKTCGAGNHPLPRIAGPRTCPCFAQEGRRPPARPAECP